MTKWPPVTETRPSCRPSQRTQKGMMMASTRMMKVIETWAKGRHATMRATAARKPKAASAAPKSERSPQRLESCEEVKARKARKAATAVGAHLADVVDGRGCVRAHALDGLQGEG